MAADPVTTCLQEATDYPQFERLCSDIMVFEDYPALEPLGGFKDSGRDAVHVARGNNRTSIFAYSVREDWGKKLDEDAKKIHRHGHTCDELVFVCTAPFTAGERDKAIRAVKKAYGWDLQLYGLERLGVLLRTKCRSLIAQHPAIFTPAFFPPIIAGIDPAVQDFVFVDYVEADEVLAVWLSRRLLAAGYRAWCRKLSLLAGERAFEAMEGVIRNHSCRVVSILSEASLRNPDAQARRGVAIGMKHRGPAFFLPVAAQKIDRGRLDYQLRDLTFVRFDASWAEGLGQLINALEAADCPRPLANGATVATQTAFLSGVTLSKPEPLYSNCFPVARVPEVIHAFKSKKPIDYQIRRTLAHRWAFRGVNDNRQASFHQPPADIAEEFGITASGGALWGSVREVEGIESRYLAIELIKKSLVVKCAERGLVRQGDETLLGFPSGLIKNERLPFTKPDGSGTFVFVVGERSVRRRAGPVTYRYHLAPVFGVRGDLGEHFTVLLRVRVNITDAAGNALPARTMASRRRTLFKGWYNHEWFARTLAIAYFLAEGGEYIAIGSEPAEQILVKASPLTWESPVSIDEAALEPVDEDDLVPGYPEDDEDDEEEPDGSNQTA